MKILFTADLHLRRATRDKTLQKLGNWISVSRPDSVVIAGDIASASQASDALGAIRRRFSDGPIAVCLGNHDFWLQANARNQCPGLSAVIDRYWVPAAHLFDIHLLDLENFPVGDVTIAGGYGHYDFGFALPGLAYQGIVVTEEDYLRGFPSSGSPLRWRDFQLMPGGLHPLTLASEQVRGVKSRLLAAGESPVIAVLHTPPYEELLGIPAPTELPDGSPQSVYAFFRAYLGNRSMGIALQSFSEKLLAIVCGHTHRQSGPLRLRNAIGINIGSDYDHPMAALYSSAAQTMERLPDP